MNRRERVRAVVYQVLAIGGFVWLVHYLGTNTAANLAARGMQTGFDFLFITASFDVGFKLISYRLGTDTYGRIFLLGVLNTLFVSACIIVVSTVMAVVIGVARLSPNWLASRIALVYVEFIRNTPVVVHLVFWHASLLYGLPRVGQSLELTGLGFAFLNNRGLYLPAPVFGALFWVTLAAFAASLAAVVLLNRWARRRQQLTGARFPVFWVSLCLLTAIPLSVHLAAGAPLSWDVPQLERFNFEGGVRLPVAFVVMLISLSIYHSGQKAEAVRAGFESVAKGQREAAYTLGLGWGQAMRLVLFPQALRAIIPPMLIGWLAVTRNASLGIVVAYPEIVGLFLHTSLNQVGYAVEIVAMVMGFYMLLSLLISWVLNAYNKRVRITEG